MRAAGQLSFGTDILFLLSCNNRGQLSSGNYSHTEKLIHSVGFIYRHGSWNKLYHNCSWYGLGEYDTPVYCLIVACTATLVVIGMFTPVTQCQRVQHFISNLMRKNGWLILGKCANFVLVLCNRMLVKYVKVLGHSNKK